MSESSFGYYESPIGLIEIEGKSEAVVSLYFVDKVRHEFDPSPIVQKAIEQIAEYFLGTRREFNLSLDLQGTPFQRSVWQHLLTIPFGRTASYQEVANAIDNPRGTRAVGAANGRNPISLIVPCHRVVGSDGSLTGYGGGLWRKKWLLEHEAKHAR